MKKPPGRFQVDPKLASLLGEGYRSSEEALRELVDNAWDADASRVSVTLPMVLDTSPIVVEDDGSGMTEEEVRSEYLRIASDRTSRKGDRTTGRNRKVKGRKGIGKFAGLMAAAEMSVETCARGRRTAVTVTKEHLTSARADVADLEAVDLPITSEKCNDQTHGTKVTLRLLNQKFEVPSAERLRALLVADYGRQNDFQISVNGVVVALDDVPGQKFEEVRDIPGIGQVKVRFTISEEKAVREAGLVIRVNGKLVGRPTSLGLEDDELIPRKLTKRVYGEIEADGLEAHVTADWGAIVENSRPFQELRELASGFVKEALRSTFKAEMNLAKARFEKDLKRRIEALPEHRRQRAEETITKLLRRLYGEAPERVEAVVSVALDAFEYDDYWTILRQIDAAARADVVRLAGILDDLGLVDVALVAHHTKRRLAFLDEFDALLGNAATVEAAVHRAVEHNLWLLGSGFSVISSNKSLAKVLADWLDKDFSGERASKRPDLFLATPNRDEYLLIEFKRPAHAITRDDENQAIKYRDDLQSHLPGKQIVVLMVGGSRDSRVATRYETTELKVHSYVELVAQAREELGWLLAQLKS